MSFHRKEPKRGAYNALHQQPALLRLRQPWRWLPFSVRLRVASWLTVARHYHMLSRSVRIVVVAAMVMIVFGASSRSQSIANRWGTTSSVIVVDETVAIGDPVGEVAWHRESRPSGGLASDALETLPQDANVMVRELLPGDVLTERDVDVTAAGSLLRDGFRAVSVPRDASVPALAVGDQTEVYVVEHAYGASTDVVRALKSVTTVLEVHEDAITLAVSAVDVETLALAALDGRVVLARR